MFYSVTLNVWMTMQEPLPSLHLYDPASHAARWPTDYNFIHLFLVSQAMELPLPNNDMLFVDVKVHTLVVPALEQLKSAIPAGGQPEVHSRCEQHGMLCNFLAHLLLTNAQAPLRGNRWR